MPPSLDVDPHGAGKTISGAAYGADARGDITGPRRNTQAPRFLKATPFERGTQRGPRQRAGAMKELDDGEEVGGCRGLEGGGGRGRGSKRCGPEAERNLLSARTQVDKLTRRVKDASPRFLPLYVLFI